MCDTITQRPALNMLITEVPVLVPEKHSLPKADFSSSNSTVELPFLPVKILEPLFTASELLIHCLHSCLHAVSANEGARSAPLKGKFVLPA